MDLVGWAVAVAEGSAAELEREGSEVVTAVETGVAMEVEMVARSRRTTSRHQTMHSRHST